jgi:NADPH-dependent curcumin reductase CurA
MQLIQAQRAMQSIDNQQWIYTTHPDGLIGPEHYQLKTQALSTELANGELLLQTRYVSVDPYMRIIQSKTPTFDELPHALGAVQSAACVALVLDSKSPNFSQGDWVEGPIGWQTHAKLHASSVRKLDPTQAPVSTALGVLGMPGRTAWFGLMEAGRPKPGDVLVVSGAGGAVGSLVAQLGKRAGCVVVGIAGGADKCAWLIDTLKLDHAFDYRTHDFQSLSQAIAQRVGKVDVYFDNVGGWISDAVMPNIARRARIVVCGLISQYSGALDAPELGPRFLHHILYQRATLQGILARDFTHRMDEMLQAMTPLVASKELVFEQTVVQGFANLPTTLQSLFSAVSLSRDFTGSHRGKLIVEVSR